MKRKKEKKWNYSQFFWWLVWAPFVSLKQSRHKVGHIFIWIEFQIFYWFTKQIFQIFLQNIFFYVDAPFCKDCGHPKPQCCRTGKKNIFSFNWLFWLHFFINSIQMNEAEMNRNYIFREKSKKTFNTIFWF